MNNAIEMMLNKYNAQNNIERENALKEIFQEIALAGLSRGGFFDNVAFYGGTCLRIFYGLDRFSEDLDFALIKNDDKFNLENYFPSLEKEFRSYGIEIKVEPKLKKFDSNVQSAFIKGNTYVLMMSFFPNNEDIKKVVSNQKIKIKFEVDITNPKGFIVETKYRMLPSPYEVKLFDESTLFAGKIHDIICRNYKNHVKGRDYYDYLFYVSKGTKINFEYLRNKLINTNNDLYKEVTTLDNVKDLLKERFENVDYESAKEDVSNFISNKSSIKLWKKELFLSTLELLNNK